MPEYEYECEKCEHTFTTRETFEQHDRHELVKCPKCGSAKVHQLLSTVHVKTAKTS